MASAPYYINEQNFETAAAPPGFKTLTEAKQACRIEDKNHLGLVERDYTTHPLCYARKAVTLDMPLIPRDEMVERIQEGHAKKQFLSYYRRSRGPNGGHIPALDQNGQGYCHTEDTEVLTDRGFVPWSEYNWSDLLATANPITGKLEFQLPFQKHVYEYDGPMIYSTNRRVDFGVTPDHRMLVQKWDEQQRTLSSDFTFQRAGDIGWYAGLPHATTGWQGTEFVELEIEGDRRYDGDDLLAMLGLIISDGYAGGTDKTKNLVSFASFREDVRPTIEALAYRLGFKEAPSRRGVWNRWNAAALANWIRTHCYTGGMRSQNKCVPAIVKEASTRQIKHFLNFFDDRSRNGLQFYTSSKRLADDLQELHLRIGKRASIAPSPPKTVPYSGNASGQICSNGGYVLTVGEVDRLCIDRKKHIEQETYKGNVYCASVPNGTLITRRNGTVLVSGNCWCYSVVGGLMILRVVHGMKYVRLSAHMPASIIKNYRDEGGWSPACLEFIVQHGVPSVEFWPEKSRSRSNDTPEMRANAKQHIPSETFIDLVPAVYNRNLSEDQRLTCLLLNNPVFADRNRWSHSTFDMELVLSQQALQKPSMLTTDFGSLDLNDPKDAEAFYAVINTKGLNSWTDNWGDLGEFIMQGNLQRMDGGGALTWTNPSIN